MFRECGRLLGAHVLANMKLLATYLIFLSIIMTYVGNEVNQSQCGQLPFYSVLIQAAFLASRHLSKSYYVQIRLASPASIAGVTLKDSCTRCG